MSTHLHTGAPEERNPHTGRIVLSFNDVIRLLTPMRAYRIARKAGFSRQRAREVVELAMRESGPVPERPAGPRQVNVYDHE